MFKFGFPELFLIGCFAFIFAVVFLLIPYWRIFKKAGFPPALCFLMLVPLVNIFMIYFLAFAEWPSLKRGQQ